MNKRIIDATREEVSKAMKDNAIRTIALKRRENVIKDISEDTGEIDIYNKYQLKQAEREELGLEFRLYKANERRRAKIKARITRMIETNRALFLTLTFSEKMFARNCSAETRRRYITRFLKSECSEYLANIDFGKEKHREHYHAVVVPKTSIDFRKYHKIFDSAILGEKIRVNDSSLKFLSTYINKLTNHALKDNGYYKRLIFSRDSKGNHFSRYDCPTN
jgi:hypothetical protein